VKLNARLRVSDLWRMGMGKKKTEEHQCWMNLADCKGSTFLCLFSNIILLKKKKLNLCEPLCHSRHLSLRTIIYHVTVTIKLCVFFPMHVTASHNYSSHSSSSQHCQSKEPPFANRAEFLTSSWPLQTRQHQVEWNPPLWCFVSKVKSPGFPVVLDVDG